jgi:hypothetical protein
MMFLIAMLLCADASPPPQKPLSKEDAELVKELALLEKMELVKNLELFEKDKDPPPSDDDPPAPLPQRQQ